ncbi:MAG: class I SAM-dependent methyltransferase [Aquabacterium sp.]|nr:class I SAM-dependent methyltransferase [Aquabacterium sp.]
MGIKDIVKGVLGRSASASTSHELARSRDPAVLRLLDDFKAGYDTKVKDFYDYLPSDVRPLFCDDALYHRARYIDMCSQAYGAVVIELGSDKPFITHFLRQLHPASEFHTISIDIPFSPYPITRIDIESERFPFESHSATDVIFTEVLEHLFRDPAWTIAEISRVLAPGGNLFLTTPNACGMDVLMNLLLQLNPNGRNQFYEAIESGHPHLWTASECRALLEAHGLEVQELTTVDYYPMHVPEAVKAFLAEHSSDPALNGQVLRIRARKVADVDGPVYIPAVFPQSRPVQLKGALLEWAKRQTDQAG